MTEGNSRETPGNQRSTQNDAGLGSNWIIKKPSIRRVFDIKNIISFLEQSSKSHNPYHTKT